MVAARVSKSKTNGSASVPNYCLLCGVGAGDHLNVKFVVQRQHRPKESVLITRHRCSTSAMAVPLVVPECLHRRTQADHHQRELTEPSQGNWLNHDMAAPAAACNVFAAENETEALGEATAGYHCWVVPSVACMVPTSNTTVLLLFENKWMHAAYLISAGPAGPLMLHFIHQVIQLVHVYVTVAVAILWPRAVTPLWPHAMQGELIPAAGAHRHEHICCCLPAIAGICAAACGSGMSITAAACLPLQASVLHMISQA